jgi:hypothetical protein
MEIINKILCAVGLYALTSFLAFGSTEEDCMKAVIENQYELVLNACVPRIGDDRNIWALVIGRHNHYLGSIESPSTAAQLIAQKAEDGDAVFQYLWGVIISLVYSPGVPTNNQDAERILHLRIKKNKIGREWLFKSADQGLVSARLMLIKQAVAQYSKPISESEHVRLMFYAKELVESNIPEAETLLRELLATSNKSQIEQEFKNKLANYESSSDEEIFDLARSLISGYFKLNKKTFSRIEIDKDKEKSKELFIYLMEKRGNAEAAYALSKTLEEDKSNPETAQRILELRKQAAAGKHPLSMRLIGVHFACKGDLQEALKLLKEADNLGEKEASSYIEEIEEYGDIYDCDES